MLVLGNYGTEVRGPLFDTMVAHYVLQPELRHNMDYLAEIYLHYQTIHIEELIGPKGKGQKNMRDLSPKLSISTRARMLMSTEIEKHLGTGIENQRCGKTLLRNRNAPGPRTCLYRTQRRACRH